MKHLAFAIVAAGFMAAWSAAGTAQTAPSPDQIVASLKQNLAESQKRLRTYEWIETTAISLKGEEKSRKQQRVYYGADGTLTKLPIGAAPAPPPPKPSGRRGGGRSRRASSRTEGRDAGVHGAGRRLIHKYVPPDAALIQKAKDAGRMQVQPVQAGIVRAEFKDFVQPADAMAIDVDAKALLFPR